MRILRRYVLGELVTPFLLSLLFFTIIFLVGSLVKLADLLVNKGVGLFDLLKILILLIPKLLSFTLPTSALTAILLVFGGFAQNNEITAMKASGVNLFSVMLPVLLVSFLLSLASLFTNDQIQSRAQFAYRQAVRDLLLKRPMAYLEAGKFIKDFQDHIILAQRVEGNRLHEITIYQPQGKGKATRTIIAEWGEILSLKDEKTLTLKLYNGTSDEPNPDNPSVFYKLNFKTFELPPIHLGREDPKKAGKKVKDMSLDEILYGLRRKPDVRDNPDLQREYKAELHKKISFSFAPFVFAMVGLPLAVITRRGEAVISFSLAIGIVALYYVFFVWSRAVTVEGYLPAFIALWLPNLFMAGSGLFLMKRILAA